MFVGKYSTGDVRGKHVSAFEFLRYPHTPEIGVVRDESMKLTIRGIVVFELLILIPQMLVHFEKYTTFRHRVRVDEASIRILELFHVLGLERIRGTHAYSRLVLGLDHETSRITLRH